MNVLSQLIQVKSKICHSIGVVVGENNRNVVVMVVEQKNGGM